MLFWKKKKKIGLALGGGAVFGAAHIGVLKAVEELKIPVSFIAGTSIGAMVSAFYAFGVGLPELEKIAKDLRWLDISGLTLSEFGLLSNKKLGELLGERIGDVELSQSKIPLAMVATDITTGERVVLKDGKLAPAVMASTCIPGIFKPVEIGERLLVDGGIVENVPLSPLHELGADYVIAVDLNANHKYKKPENIIEVLLNSFHFALQTTARLQTEDADLLIQPDLSEFNRIDLNQVEELIEAGYTEAMKVLKDIGK